MEARCPEDRRGERKHTKIATDKFNNRERKQIPGSLSNRDWRTKTVHLQNR